MTRRETLKSSNDVTLARITLSQDGGVVGRAYSVCNRRTGETVDMGSAETLFEQEVISNLSKMGG